MPLRRILVVTLALVLPLRAGAAVCGDNAEDAAAVAAARSAVVMACDCAGAPTHGAFVRCAAAIARARVLDGSLPPACRAVVKRCARRSTCGRPGAITCCQARGASSRCTIRPEPSRCRAPAGGTACLGEGPSCCDACEGTTCMPPRPPSCLYVGQPPASCASDASCPSGYQCLGGACQAGPCTVRSDCPADGECVLSAEGFLGTCVCQGCDAVRCPRACRQGLLGTTCTCQVESDCPPEDDVCFLGLCS